MSLLYNLPLRALFDRYFRHCFEELENTIKHSGSTVKINLENNQSVADYCSYQELLNSPRITESDADRIRRHIKILVEERSKKILGN